MPSELPEFLSTTIDGLWYTLAATAGGIGLATVLSFVFGLAMLSQHIAVRAVARVYVEVWRGTSEVVQLLWIFFVLPVLVGYEIVPLAVGIMVLGMNFGAYGAEIVRGAVQSVPQTQHESCVALNLTKAQRLRRVIVPQALVEMIPPFNNLFIQLLKGSALLTVIRVSEITHQAHRVLLPRNVDKAALIWSIVLVLYLLVAIAITLLMRWLERRAALMVGRTPPERRSWLASLRARKAATDPVAVPHAGGGGR